MESKIGKGFTIIAVGILFLAIAMAVFGYFFLQNVFAPYRQAVASTKEVERRFGNIDEYFPHQDAIAPQQVERFISVLRRTKEIRGRISETMHTANFSEVDSLNGPAFDWRHQWRDALKFTQELAIFYQIRNRALLDAEMGLGEYYCIYSLVYYGWLKKNLFERRLLPFKDMTINSDEYVWYTEKIRAGNDAVKQTNSSNFSVFRVRQIVIPALRGEEKALLQKKSSSVSRGAIRAELKKLDANKERIPFQDDLHPIIFKPVHRFRGQLESLYNSITDSFELFPIHKNKS